MPLNFRLLAGQGRARAGVISTPHGDIPTPALLVVGTKATVKALGPDDLERAGVPGLLCNTYHLWIRPGPDLIASLGGLHRFMGWPGPIMTDSGGFQVFSLGWGLEHGVGKIGFFPGDREPGAAGVKGRARLARVDEEGVTFTSHLDGSRLRLTPELSIAIQEKLGGDIILAFDECTSPFHDHAYTRLALERTHRWARRCLEAHTSSQALYGIVQGGCFPDLRRQAARFIGSLPFDGYAVGGSLGRSKEDMHQVLDWTLPLLPEGRPRHLLGIGEPDDLFEAVARGVDTFDCVAPTRLARNGALLISPEAGGRRENRFRLPVLRSAYAADDSPPDPRCSCYTCRRFSRAYLRHLFKEQELLAYRLASLHNVHFICRLMREIRESILDGFFPELKRRWLGP